MITSERALEMVKVWIVTDDYLPALATVVGRERGVHNVTVICDGIAYRRWPHQMFDTHEEAVAEARFQIVMVRDWCRRDMDKIATAIDKLDGMSADGESVPLGVMPTPDDTATAEIRKHDLGGEA